MRYPRSLDRGDGRAGSVELNNLERGEQSFILFIFDHLSSYKLW
jgi:hypothetical protein